MGSSSSLFANMVIDGLENYCLNIIKNRHNCFPRLYYRYVDDIILCFKRKYIDLVRKTINSYDSNLQFIHEIQLLFSITIKSRAIDKKNPICSSRIINHLSNHPRQQKSTLFIIS